MNETDDSDDDSEDDDAIKGADPLNEDGEPRRKRRRNRRSRRGRRKKSQGGAEAEGTVEGAGDASDDDRDAVGSAESNEQDVSAPAPRERVHFSQADHVDGEPVAPARGASDDEADDDDGDDDVAGVESMSEGAPRPRRRGRRGRRGGARRSRGRREKGEGEGPAADSGGEAE